MGVMKFQYKRKNTTASRNAPGDCHSTHYRCGNAVPVVSQHRRRSRKRRFESERFFGCESPRRVCFLYVRVFFLFCDLLQADEARVPSNNFLISDLSREWWKSSDRRVNSAVRANVTYVASVKEEKSKREKSVCGGLEQETQCLSKPFFQ